MVHSLNNISPIDGRYSGLTKELQNYFSESALINYRVYIEIQYFIALHKYQIPELKTLQQKEIKKLLKYLPKYRKKTFSKSRE